jgi:hypothetical protein
VKSPAPAQLTFTPDPSVTATVSLSKTCVHPGDTMTLTVNTIPKGAVAYVAIYSDGNNGSKGFGGGYGGNDGGKADANGMYTSTWTFAPNTPTGPARVDVYVNDMGKQNYKGTNFMVKSPTGAC